jgi:lactoylglutathione lyase
VAWHLDEGTPVDRAVRRSSARPNGKETDVITSAFPIITTPDLERALGFYRDLLGGVVSFAFPPEGPPAYVGVDLGSSHLGIGHDPAIALDGEQRIVLWVYTADCDAVVEAVRAGGGTVVEEAVDQPWGERVARVTDPDGNRVVVGQAGEPPG